MNSQAQQQGQGIKKKRKMQSFLTKGKCCIPAESLWLPAHPLDPGYLQAKHKTKDICSKPTGGHCDSTEEKKIQLAFILKTSHHWDWDLKPALGSEAKTH